MPSATITFGRIVCTWRNTNGSHAATSSGSGLRFSGGRHLMMFAMYTSSRVSSIASMIFVSSCPALPTNGMPCTSSSWPGASPMNMSSAEGLPTPKTICRRPSVCSLQRVQSPRSSRMMVRVSTPALAAVAVSPDIFGRVAGRLRSRRRVASVRWQGGTGAGSPARVRQAGSRLMPSTPRSRKSLRCSASWALRVLDPPWRCLCLRRAPAAGRGRGLEEALDAIEDGRGHRRLGLQRQRFVPVAPNQRDDVGVDLESGAGLQHVVGDDEVGALRLELPARASHEVVGLGGEPDDDGARLAADVAATLRAARGCPASCAA